MPAFNWAFLARVLLVWIAIALAETAQGLVRRLWPAERLHAAAQAFWILLGLAVVFILTAWSANWMRLRTVPEALGVGVLWAALMLGYELFIAQLAHFPAAAFLAQYDPRQGGLMGFALVLMSLTPWLVLRLKRR